MKKLFTLLFATLMVLLPAGVFADEQEVTSDSATVQLTASKASSYKVKLPQTVDVSSNSTTFNVYAKGDIASNQKITVSVGEGDHILKDVLTTSSKQANLSVSVSNGDFLFENLGVENYSQEKYATFTVTHETLSAGSYAYNLPIVIELN